MDFSEFCHFFALISNILFQDFTVIELIVCGLESPEIARGFGRCPPRVSGPGHKYRINIKIKSN